MRITIPKTEYDKIYEQAMKVRPEEACGLIAGHDEDDKRVIEEVYVLTNIDHTNEHFTIDPKEQLLAVKDMRSKGLKPLGNWHSHPETPSRPSEEDKRLANDSKASYLIISLEDEENPVLNAFHIEGDQDNKTSRKEDLEVIG